MDIPDSLRHRLDLFRQSGKVFKKADELFGENSWIQVLLGQGMRPEQYHPIVNHIDQDELVELLDKVQKSVQHRSDQLPDHHQFIEHYCKAEDKMMG